MSAERWLMLSKPNPQARLRLFCLPYAGGGAALYRGWAAALPAAIEVCAVQLPGRETRWREPPFTRMAPLIEALAAVLAPYLDRPFALFGHSMGALIAFEAARRLRGPSGLGPVHLMVAAHRAPQLPPVAAPCHALPDAALKERLITFNGTPAEVLANAELMALLLPLVRSDFELVETYTFADAPLLDCPLTAMGGADDAETSKEALDAWRAVTRGRFRLRLLPGGHFFIHQSGAALLAALSAELQDYL